MHMAGTARGQHECKAKTDEHVCSPPFVKRCQAFFPKAFEPLLSHQTRHSARQQIKHQYAQ
eukprot:1160256-Pelagomonas_calceolata.AAC.11